MALSLLRKCLSRGCRYAFLLSGLFVSSIYALNPSVEGFFRFSAALFVYQVKLLKCTSHFGNVCCVADIEKRDLAASGDAFNHAGES